LTKVKKLLKWGPYRSRVKIKSKAVASRGRKNAGLCREALKGGLSKKAARGIYSGWTDLAPGFFGRQRAGEKNKSVFSAIPLELMNRAEHTLTRNGEESVAGKIF
jgi:hypothetical protein